MNIPAELYVLFLESESTLSLVSPAHCEPRSTGGSNKRTASRAASIRAAPEGVPRRSAATISVEHPTQPNLCMWRITPTQGSMRIFRGGQNPSQREPVLKTSPARDCFQPKESNSKMSASGSLDTAGRACCVSILSPPSLSFDRKPLQTATQTSIRVEWQRRARA